MNVADAEELSSELERRGHKRTDNPKNAEAVIIYTCAVRETAEERIWGRLGFYKTLKQTNPKLKVIVAGCMAQRLKSRMFENSTVDAVFGTYSRVKIVEFIESFTDSIDVSMKTPYRFMESVPLPETPHRAYISISHGCNNFCTYCIVPFVRGREVSRKPDDVIEEVKRLVDLGVVHITLLGQNVNSYGSDLENAPSFPELLWKIAETDGLKRLWFLTSHPKDFTRELAEAMTHPKIVKTLHLPIQSGSDRVLKDMNRGYTAEEYLEKVEIYKKFNPDGILTTDILVGFPTETESDFIRTLEVSEKAGFDYAYTFYYNPREGTPAYRLKDPVPLEEKKRRLAVLVDRVRKWTAKSVLRDLGKEFEVLIDKPAPRGGMLGETETGRMVVVEGNYKAGSFVKAKVVRISGTTPVCTRSTSPTPERKKNVMTV